MKIVLGIVVVLVILGGAYYFITASPEGEAVMEDLKSMTNTLTEGSDIPGATGSVDDFSAAMNAELAAQAEAINALDADVDADVEGVVNSGSNTYDPNSI